MYAMRKKKNYIFEPKKKKKKEKTIHLSTSKSNKGVLCI